jgi:hypothetical protein
MVAGDDSLVFVKYQDHEYFFEGDAKMFDQSQSAGPLLFERKVLAYMGAETFVIETLEAMSTNPYVLTYKDRSRVIIGRQLRPIRDTGGPDTTFGNSLLMAAAWVSVFDVDEEIPNLPTLEDVRKEFMRLGFDMKLKITSKVTSVSFLKGAWYKVRHSAQWDRDLDYVWGPLPSRILKVGKSFEDPRTFYRGLPFEAACERFLHDQGASLKSFCCPPILSDFVHRWSKGRAAPPEEWSITASGRLTNVLDEHALYEFFFERYGLLPEQVRQARDLVSSAAPFTFMVSPAFLQMALVDYAHGAPV